MSAPGSKSGARRDALLHVPLLIAREITRFGRAEARPSELLVIQLVDFGQAYTGRVVCAADNGGVVARPQGLKDGGFTIDSRRNASGRNLGGVACILQLSLLPLLQDVSIASAEFV